MNLFVKLLKNIDQQPLSKCFFRFLVFFSIMQSEHLVKYYVYWSGTIYMKENKF